VGGVIQEIEKAEYDDLMGKSKGAPRFVPEREHITADGLVSPQRIAPALLSGEDPAAVGKAEVVAESPEADSISAVSDRA
jgi:hypothetical protein